MIHPTAPVGYLVNEHDSTVTTFDLSDVRRPVALGSTSTLPRNTNPGENTTAAIHVDPQGEPLLASNRGHESIALFYLGTDPTDPACRDTPSCGGEWPREFTFSPDGGALYVCNQRSDTLDRLSFSDGDLREFPDGGISVATRACIKFRCRPRP